MRFASACAFVMFVMIVAAGPAHAQDEHRGDGQHSATNAARSSLSGVFGWPARATRLTGDWGGLRPRLEERGVSLGIFYNHYYARKNGGGPDLVSSARHSGSLDLLGRFDLTRMGLGAGAEVLLHVKSIWSDSINAGVGAVSAPIDDADGNHSPYVHQVYYQHSSPGRRFQFRAGYFDQQTILDRNAFANFEDRQFMSTYLDNNNATIPLAIGVGVAVFINPTDWLSFVVTASDAEAPPFQFTLDTAFDGDADYLTYFETDLKLALPVTNGGLDGNYRVGVFLDPRDRAPFGEDRVVGATSGFYVSVDQEVYGARDGGTLGLFARYGWRPGHVHRIGHFVSAGAQYDGLLPRRPMDVLGVGMYSVRGSGEYRRWVEPDFGRETGYEAYYNVQLFPAATLTPALQYIHHPGGFRSRQDVFVVTLRARLTL